MKIHTFTFNPFYENTYVIANNDGECIIIDPGCYEIEEKDILEKFISDNNYTVKRLINTHCHIDHVLGNSFVKNKYKVILEGHKDDQETLKAVEAYAPSYGFSNYESTEMDSFLSEHDEISLGDITFKILFVPGHAPGHIALYNEKEKVLIGGDVLFNGSIGRTDLPGGDFDTLANSIKSKFYTLPDDVIVYSGHGDSTTIGKEKVSNPFVKA
ncbi:MBL fold metallo-hydrolase [Marinigracilibium pacificum]|uniref:MBL fold metallo-hydrolase n=1 Tax=Marinigracilibium pacificum TaxID=2729599 RepID=A0A848J6B8_9BACT|nr:MBL fold metallo-hydrolase [Marinigracilibium pacificum]NMM48672.1 MBL fold metallo-hydrolase [Marinigracilibium pacificum]